MNNRRMSWIVVLAMGLAAAAVILRRRFQSEEELPRLPLPEPPEPPRIVLPRTALEPEETAPSVPAADDAPRERAVGEKPQSARGGASSTATAATPKPRPTPEPATSEEADEVSGYCMRCRERRTIVEPEEVVTESGRHAVTGSCAECGTRIFRFISGKA